MVGHSYSQFYKFVVRSEFIETTLNANWAISSSMSGDKELTGHSKWSECYLDFLIISQNFVEIRDDTWTRNLISRLVFKILLLTIRRIIFYAIYIYIYIQHK